MRHRTGRRWNQLHDQVLIDARSMRARTRTARRRTLAALIGLVSACSEFRRGPLEAGASDDAAASCGAAISGACNVVAQTGCSIGQSCVIALRAGGDPYTLCGVAGAGAYGSRCTTVDACENGLACLNGQCRATCCPNDPNACTGSLPSGAGCYVDVGLDAVGVRACGVPCDWHAQQCANGGTCVPLDTRGMFSDCRAPGPGVDGDPCRRGSDCATGLVCVVAGTGVCRAICDTTAPSCAFPYTCSSLTNAPPEFGVCDL